MTFAAAAPASSSPGCHLENSPLQPSAHLFGVSDGLLCALLWQPSGQQHQLCPSGVFLTPQGHPVVKVCWPAPRSLVSSPWGPSALWDHRTPVPIASSHPRRTRFAGMPGTDENAEWHIIRQCLELPYGSSNAWKRAPWTPRPLLQTREHVLLGMFPLAAPEMYVENSLSRGRPRWEAQSKPLCRAIPCIPCAGFSRLASWAGCLFRW